MQPSPISPYGVSKYRGELYAQAFPALLRPRVRLSPVSSTSSARGKRPGFSLFRRTFPLRYAFLQDGQPVVYGDGEQTRDFHLRRKRRPGQISSPAKPRRVPEKVFNVGTGSRVFAHHILDLLRKSRGKSSGQIRTPARWATSANSQGKSAARGKSSLRANRFFEEGLRRTYGVVSNPPHQGSPD